MSDFQRVNAIFFSTNQQDLEAAMWGRPISGRDARQNMRDRAEAQIAQAEHQFPNPIPYRAMAQLQLGILQMGLGESYTEVGFSILKGVAESWRGDEYDIVNMSTLGFAILAHWTDRSDKDGRLRCNIMVNWLVDNELSLINRSSSSSKQSKVA